MLQLNTCKVCCCEHEHNFDYCSALTFYCYGTKKKQLADFNLWSFILVNVKSLDFDSAILGGIVWKTSLHRKQFLDGNPR